MVILLRKDDEEVERRDDIHLFLTVLGLDLIFCPFINGQAGIGFNFRRLLRLFLNISELYGD